jgi:hypothetical protein
MGSRTSLDVTVNTNICPLRESKPGRLHHIQSHDLSRLYRKTLLSVSFYITNSVAPEPAGSSPYSQEPATGPYPELNVSTLHSRSQSP